MRMQNMGTREIGIVILVMSIVLLALMISITDQLNQSLNTGCVCDAGACPMSSNLPIQSYIGFSLIIVLAGFGGFLIFKSRQFERLAKGKETEHQKNIKTLNADEKRAYETIADSDDVIFQGDLIDKLEFSKVKVSRILDRLEHRGLVERRRRGMSNIIILKHGR